MCLSKQCPKCGGDLFREQYPDGDTSFECLQCGYVISLKKEPQTRKTEPVLS